MNYKIVDFTTQLSFIDVIAADSNYDALTHKNNRFYISKPGQDDNFRPLDGFPSVIQAINDINDIISRTEIKKACVYCYLMKIDEILSKSPSPHPDDLALMFLPNLLRLISGSNDEDTKTISLKIILYITLSTNEKITNLYDADMIEMITYFVSLRKPKFNFIAKSYISNLIFSCAILNNILICSKKRQDIYDMYMNGNLLKYLNEKLLTLSSYQEIQYIFILIIQLLQFSVDQQKGISQFNFIIPSLKNLLSYSGISEKSLEVLYIFLQDYDCLQECLSNELQNDLFNIIINDNFKTSEIHHILKCINVLCSDSLISPFGKDIFYQKLIDCIESSGANGINEIFTFFLKVIQSDFGFDQNDLIQKILDVVEKNEFSYKSKCINFFIVLIHDSILKVSDELYNQVAFYILYAAYQLHEDYLNDCLNVIDFLLEKHNQISENILADPEFFDFLNECSNNQTLDKESCEISMALLKKYGYQ